MANKTPTVYEPIASDMQAITLICQGGAVTSIEVSANVRSDDAALRPPGNCDSIPGDYTAGTQTAMGILLTEALGVLKTKLGF